MPCRAIAREFSVAKEAVNRHKGHMGKSLVRASERHDINLGESLLTKLDRMELTFVRLSQKAELLGELPAAIVAMKEVRETLKLIHEMQSSMKTVDAPQYQIGFNYDNSEDVALRDKLLTEGNTREVTAAHVAVQMVRRLMRNQLAISSEELLKNVFQILLEGSDGTEAKVNVERADDCEELRIIKSMKDTSNPWKKQ